jgi:hypothetical protein
MSAPSPTPDSPFTRGGNVKGRAWQVPMDEALAAANAAGFRMTTRSGPNRAYVQRDGKTAATISPTPGGVVVKPAWTTGQMVIVAGVLVLLFFGVCGIPGALVPVAP